MRKRQQPLRGFLHASEDTDEKACVVTLSSTRQHRPRSRDLRSRSSREKATPRARTKCLLLTRAGGGAHMGRQCGSFLGLHLGPPNLLAPRKSPQAQGCGQESGMQTSPELRSITPRESRWGCSGRWYRAWTPRNLGAASAVLTVAHV